MGNPLAYSPCRIFTNSGKSADKDIGVWIYSRKGASMPVFVPSYYNLWLKLSFILLQISHNSLQVRITVDFDYKDGVYHFIDRAVGNYKLASRVLEVIWLLNEKFAWIIDFNDLTISVLYGESDFVCGKGTFKENRVSLSMITFLGW